MMDRCARIILGHYMLGRSTPVMLVCRAQIAVLRPTHLHGPDVGEEAGAEPPGPVGLRRGGVVHPAHVLVAVAPPHWGHAECRVGGVENDKF